MMLRNEMKSSLNKQKEIHKISFRISFLSFRIHLTQHPQLLWVAFQLRVLLGSFN